MELAFRGRLVVVFIAVAALSGGVVATTSYALTASYRRDAFERQAGRHAQTSLESVRGGLPLDDFEEMLTDIQRRGGFSTVAVGDGLTFAPDPRIDAGDVPDEAVPPPSGGRLLAANADVDGKPFHVVGGRVGSAETNFYFFFPRSELEDSLAELRRMLLLGWLAAVALAALFGSVVARRALRPVRRATEASQAIADRERQFTADVAHELRTPLTGMVSAASVLESHLPDLHDGPRRPAELLVSDVRRLRELVVELLELARLDAGREEPRLEPVSVHLCIESIVAPWQRDGVVRLDVSESLWVCADRIRFARVVANLVSNAIRHGGGDVEVTARREGGRVVVDVMDHGPGVPDEVARQVFERFTRLNGSGSTEGSGLGLAIAAKQAEVQDGTLSVHSRPGGGAIFRFTLPAAEPPEGGEDEADGCAPTVEPVVEPAVERAMIEGGEEADDGAPALEPAVTPAVAER